MGEVVHVFQDFAIEVSLLSVLLSVALAVFSIRKSVHYSESRRELADRLKMIEVECRADLSDSNDREIRKIVSFLHHYDDRSTKDTFTSSLKMCDVVQKEKYKNIMDYYIFASAFEGLDGRYRESLLDKLQTERGAARARYIRNLLVHAHMQELDTSTRSGAS